MKKLNYFVLVSALLSVGAAVSEDKIYESVDKQGVTEFSDQPSASSEQIEVTPNVVDTAPAPPITPDSASTSPAAAVKSSQPSSTEKNFEENSDIIQYDDGRRLREIGDDSDIEVVPRVRDSQEAERIRSTGEDARGDAHLR